MSNGQKIFKSIIDARIRKAKAEKLEDIVLEKGYHSCNRCGRSSGVRLDLSHNTSVKECQESGMSELAWDKSNLELICRICHQEKDGLDLKFKND